MPKTSVLLKLEPQLLERIDAAIGDMTRTAWITLMIERALDGRSPDPEPMPQPDRGPPRRGTAVVGHVAPARRTEPTKGASRHATASIVTTKPRRFVGIDAITGEEIWR